MKLNSEIKNILLAKGISSDEGLLYLLALHFGLNVSCIPDTTIKRVNLSGIVTRVLSNGNWDIQWNIMLFEGANTPPAWEWVQDYRNLFKKKNPDRTGAKSNCIKRMQWFFSQYPQYRAEDVMRATKAYLATVSDPQYCKSAHKFIYEGTGQFRNSILLEWCERIAEHVKSNNQLTFKKMGD